jgi:hypothetical protein
MGHFCGACICAWQITALFFISWVAFGCLFPTACGNARVSPVRTVFSSGQIRLQTLVVEQPMSQVEAQRIRDHAELLLCLASEAPLAKWMGFEVSWSLLRTIGVTVLTVVAAMWGIVRGLGVRLTVESFCGI